MLEYPDGWFSGLVMTVALVLLGCGPGDVIPLEDTGTEAAETSSDPPVDLPADDPRWCVQPEQDAEVRMPTTEVEIACDGEPTQEACEANPACTAVLGRAVQCTDAGVCATEAVEFLGCIPFIICKPGLAIYCREIQGELSTYVSMQGTCTPFGMMNCETSPDYAEIGELPPDCG
jgi:hypothetical protein